MSSKDTNYPKKYSYPVTPHQGFTSSRAQSDERRDNAKQYRSSYSCSAKDYVKESYKYDYNKSPNKK